MRGTLGDEELADALRERTEASSSSPAAARARWSPTLGIGTVPPHPPDVVDTTARRSFTAALAVALAEGQPVERAVEFAAVAGSHTVTIAGVVPASPPEPS
ncbi:hypothetical protein GCM10023238_32460 [Streptomyces heliomycini]